MSTYPFRGREQTKTLEELVDIYENQIINQGSPEYKIAIIELIKERYQSQGLSDYDVFLEPEGNIDDRSLDIRTELVYLYFEEKVINMITAYDNGEEWKPNKTVKIFKN